MIQHGTSTLTISLPANWVKQHGVGKGDELDIDDLGSHLLVSSTKEVQGKETSLAIGKNERLGKSMLSAAFRSGYDKILLSYDNPMYIDVVQSMLSYEIMGFEVVQQQRTSCVIRDLAGVRSEEFSVAFRRLWMLLLGIADDCLGAAKTYDVAVLKNFSARDTSINRFSNYCLRIIRKRFPWSGEDFLLYRMLFDLEAIGDEYKEISLLSLQKKRSLQPRTIELFSETNDMLKDLYAQFYQFKPDILNKSFLESKKLIAAIESFLSTQRMDLLIVVRLLKIVGRVRSLFSAIVEMHE